MSFKNFLSINVNVWSINLWSLGFGVKEKDGSERNLRLSLGEKSLSNAEC